MPLHKFILSLLITLIPLSVFSQDEDIEIDLSAPHDSFWHGFNTGCIGRNIAYDIFWSEYETDLSLNSFAFGFIPDTNNGPSFFARLNTGTSIKGLSSRHDNPATVFLSWSLGSHSCIVKTDFQQCPQAEKVLKKLSKLKIAVNDNFDNKFGTKAFHWTDFYLQVMDGANHFNSWQTTSGDTELEKTILESTQSLYQCSKRAAEDLFKQLKIDKSNDQYKYHIKRLKLTQD